MRKKQSSRASPVRTLLVDNSPVFLKAAVNWFSTDPRIEIVGCARSARSALKQVNRLRPDLVLMDLVMPEMNGLEATRRIKMKPNAPRVVILTLYDHSRYRVAAKQAGADGFVAKADLDKLWLLLDTFFSKSHNGRKANGR